MSAIFCLQFIFMSIASAAWEIKDFATLEHSLWTTGGVANDGGLDGAMTIYHFRSAVVGLQRV